MIVIYWIADCMIIFLEDTVMQSVTVQISLGTTSYTIDTTYIVVVCMVLLYVGRLRGGIYSTTLCWQAYDGDRERKETEYNYKIDGMLL